MRNPFKRQPRPIDKPTLKQRAAALKATAGRLIRKPAAMPPDPAPEAVDWHSPPPGFMAFPAIEPMSFLNIRYGIVAELERLRDIARAEYARREPLFRESFTQADLGARLSALHDELRLSALDAAITDPKTLRAADADLCALAGPWEAACRLYDQRMEEQIAVSEAAGPGLGEAPAGAGADWQEWRRRCDERREQTGIADAEDASGDACRALGEIEDQIAALPAHTLAGLRLKARVAERNSSIDVEWPEGLGDSLVADLLSLADSLPAAPVHADAELIALGHAFDAATARDREANDALSAAEDRAEPRLPERPAALIYREGDNLFPLREYGDAFAGIAVNPSDIEWMTRRPAQREVWVDDPRARPGWSMVPGKKPRIVHWPEAQARIDEIAAAWDAWHAEQDRVLDEAGVTEARNTTADTSDEAAALARQIAAQPARTVGGMRAKLRVAAFYCVCDPDTPEGEGYPGEAAIRSLYRDTPGIKISTNPSDVRIVSEA